MSCSTPGRRGWLRINTMILCNDCTLHLGATASHRVVIENLGVLEAKFEMSASCKGDHLHYEGGGNRSWSAELTVPPRRGDPGREETSRGIELSSDAAIGQQGTDEEIATEVKRMRGNGTPENPVTLSLRIKLRP
jgi:hypothetical protein